MTDIRTRLADALRGCDVLADMEVIEDDGEALRHLADVLLSLPCIAIVELPDADTSLPADSVLCQWLEGDVSTVRGSRRARCHLEDHRLTSSHARVLAAALLAAANAAEAAPAQAWNGEGPWPGDNVLGAWR